MDSAYNRKERGAHAREDFTKSDKNFMKHLYWQKGEKVEIKTRCTDFN